jgi:hypothetical protein
VRGEVDVERRDQLSSNSSSSWNAEFTSETPALLTTMSRRPAQAIVSATSDRSCTGSATSHDAERDAPSLRRLVAVRRADLVDDRSDAIEHRGRRRRRGPPRRRTAERWRGAGDPCPLAAPT